MKKICMFLFIGVFLTLMVSLPGVSEEEQKAKVKFTINVGGLFASISQGYDFSSSYYDAKWTESIPNIGGKFGFDIGVGVYPISQLEIYASYSSYSGTALGDYSLDFPSWWDYDETVSDSIADVKNEFKASIFSLGFAFHPVMEGKIKPYFGVGFSNVSVKVDLLDSGSIDNSWDVEYYWDYNPPYFWENIDGGIDITRVGVRKESEAVWGFHAKAGINIEIGRNICIFGEARYLSAAVKFDHQDITFTVKTTVDYYEDYYGSIYEFTDTWTDTEEFEVDDELDIKVGGVQGIIGIKFTF